MSNTIEAPSPRLELRRAILLSGAPAWQIAYAAEMSSTVLSYICTGRRAPSDKEAERLAAVLNTSVEELFPSEEAAEAR